MTERIGRSALSHRLRLLRLKWVRFTQPVLGPLRVRWRSSLKLRTMTITGLVTGFMIVIAGTFILTSVGDELYSTRRTQVLQDSARATTAAQRTIDASDVNGRAAMNNLAFSVRRTVQDTSASQLIYMRRQPDQVPAPDAPVDSAPPQLVDVVTPELADAVRNGEAPQYWQPVTLTDDTGVEAPGILVASTLTFPGTTGTYDLFIGYEFADTERALSFITRTLAITALFLMLLIGGLVLVISNIVFRPIRVAADTSRRLAGGDREARMPLQNDEHFDQLSQGFNDMADTLQSRIDELDRLSEMQQRFVSDVSHELRTPLTTVRLASEVLKTQDHDPESSQARAIEVLGDQVDRFESLLTDLLEISRYDAGRVIIATEPTNLVALTREVVDGLRSLSPSPIEVRTEGGFTSIDVDPRRIRRIVSNLVGNAIEHGEGHPIVVSIDSNAGAVAIGVRDWGVGLSAEHVVHVFDRFWRADPSRKRTLGGTGLGLAIAQEDAAVHGGVLEAWSRLGEGSHFLLTLPRGGDSSFVSPIPLVPEDVTPDQDVVETAGRWMRRGGRRTGRGAGRGAGRGSSREERR